MPLFDTHAHLLMDRVKAEPHKLIEDAEENQVIKIMNIALGPSPEQFNKSLEIMETNPNIHLAAGIHPHSAKDSSEEYYEMIVENADKISAWGEIGLDYHYNYSEPDTQKKVLARQLDLAAQINKPVVLHLREAFKDSVEIIKHHEFKPGSIVHCFSGNKSEARAFLDLGFYISFSGIVTFPNAHDVQEAALYTPADRLLVETDSPFLAPVPFRGKICTPAHVVHTAKYISKIKNIDFETFCRTTFENSCKALNIII
ncbi:MAG: TatD family hydrolase [Deltaproteobacteria bacterium]|jgi:TatD DNase family protein|nr:TatD family hydrolase [Deltaproteobacteria bacterium]